MQPFPERLAQLMSEHGTSQQTLGNAIGVARQSVAQYLDGNTQPNAEKICAIADYYGVSTDYLLGRTTCKSVDVDIQGICQKTGLWNEAAERLILLNKFDQRAICEGFDSGDTQVPSWMYEAFMCFVNLFILDEDAPFLSAKAYHAAENIEKGATVDVDAIDRAREATAQIDPELLVLSPRESESFFRHRAEMYGREMLDRFIECLRDLVRKDQKNGKA